MRKVGDAVNALFSKFFYSSQNSFDSPPWLRVSCFRHSEITPSPSAMFHEAEFKFYYSRMVE